MDANLDRICIRDLSVRGIIGVNPDEREHRQNVVVNVVLGVDTRAAGASDDIADTVDYGTVADALVYHIETSSPFTLERLAADLVQLCFKTSSRIQAVELTVDKPRAIRFASSTGVSIYRQRKEG